MQVYDIRIACSVLIFLCPGDYEASILSPSAEVDTVWHLHILDTREYAKINSRTVLRDQSAEAKMLHHNPLGGEDAGRAKRYEATLQARLRRTLICFSFLCTLLGPVASYLAAGRPTQSITGSLLLPPSGLR